MAARAVWTSARERWRIARGVPQAYRKLAWTSVKLLGAYALAEAAKRVRAGPLALDARAPLRVVEGEPVIVEARVESPFPLVDLAAYFGGEWQPSASLEPGIRRERWVFTAHTAGLRPLVMRARDAEGHALTRTRWVLVLPAATRGLAPARRLRPEGPARRAAAAASGVR